MKPGGAILHANPRIFRGRATDELARLRQAMETWANGATGEPEGIAEILVAVFDEPDTHPAVGNQRVQTIDQGAFRAYLASSPYPEPFFLDHGEAYKDGIHRATLLIASVRGGKEVREGLLIEVAYNLRMQAARDAVSQLLHEPDIVQFSFGSDVEHEQVDVVDGDEHVTEIWPVEYSQVGFGAQEKAHLVSARAAIGSHSAATDEGAWDAAVARRRCPSERGPLRALHGWVNPDGDAATLAAYKFPHHLVSADGEVGAASVKGAQAGIAVLNGARGGADIPDEDKQGVWRHLAKHVRDGGAEPAELRTASPGDVAAAMRHAGGPAAGGRSLEALPREVRESWWAEFEILSRALGAPAFPEEVFADEGSDDAGFLVVNVAGKYMRVAWERGDEEEILFDTRGASELEVQWVETNGASRSGHLAAIRTMLPLALIEDPEFARDVKAAVERVQAGAPPEDPEDPDAELRGFYRDLMQDPSAPVPS